MFTSPWRHQASAEAARRRNREITYTQPLGLDAAAGNDADLAALQSFMKDFYPRFYSREKEAARQQVLDTYPDVATQFLLLVPKVVSPEEFWQRYDYRCDEQRILQEWERHPTRGRQVMSAAMSTWFDAKVEAVKKTVTEATTTTPATTEEASNSTDTESKTTDSSSIQNDSMRKKATDSSKKKATKSYVIPQRRRDRSVSKVNARAESLRSDAKNIEIRRQDNRTNNKPNFSVDTQKNPQSSALEATKDKKVSHAAQHSISVDLLILICSLFYLMIPFLAKELISQRTRWCAAYDPPIVDLNSSSNDPWLSNVPALTHKAQPLLCRGVDVPMVEASSKNGRKEQKQKVKFQKKQKQQKDYQSKDHHNPSASAAALYSDKSYGGNDSIDNSGMPSSMNDDDGGGLVQSLISSWMQNTDMAQFENFGGMTDGNNGGSFWGNNNNPVIAAPPSEHHTKGGLVGFFQRKFRRNPLPSHALATPSQPQMVVHQHIHHVVHHVVHEVKHS